MVLPPGSNGLFDSAASYLSSGLNASWTMVRRISTLSNSTALVNALSLIWQPLGVTFPGGAGLADHGSNVAGVSRVMTVYPTRQLIVAVTVSTGGRWC